MSAIGSKLESAVRTQQVSMQIKNAVPGLKNCLKQMEKSGVSKNIGLFEKTFEDLDVQIDTTVGALDSVGAESAADQDAVS